MRFALRSENLVWYGFLVFNRTPVFSDAASLATMAHVIGETLRAEYEMDPTPIYDVLEPTRRELAEAYLREENQSH